MPDNFRHAQYDAVGVQIDDPQVGDLFPPNAVEFALAVAAPGSALIYFSPSPGATSYTVTSSTGQVVSGTSSPITVPNLPNGLLQSFTITANTFIGQSTPVTTNSVTPTALPSFLTGVNGVMAMFDADAITPVADGAAIASWADSSGNGYSAAQATSTQQPVYKIAANWGGGTTGRPAVRFDGASSNGDSLPTTLTSSLLSAEATIFVVFACTGLTNGSGAGTMRVISNESSRFDRGFSILTNSAVAGGGGGTSFVTIAGGSSELNSSSPDALVANTPVIVSVVCGKQLFVNGKRYAPPGIGLAALLPRKQPFVLGNIQANTGALGLAGDIAFALFVRGALNDTQRQAIEAALGTKYGITVVAQAAI